MADRHRPNRLSVPARTAVSATRQYLTYPHTPTPTPSKTRLSSNPKSHTNNRSSSISFLLLLLFSLRSLFSLFPFLRSSPSFSLFPFSFLVCLFSFLLSLPFSLLQNPKKDPFSRSTNGVVFFSSFSPSQLKLLLCKSVILAVVFLLRFQALRYCGAAAMILAELSGTVAARFVVEGKNLDLGDRNENLSSKVRGFCFLIVGLLLLSISWDRIDCFPFSSSLAEKWGFWFYPREDCIRIWPMLLPFLSGFFGCYEKVSMNWGAIRQLDQKRVRLISLFFTSILLFIPAVVSFMFFEGDEVGVSVGNLGWALANTVVFGVLLSENYSDGRLVSSKDFEKEFLVTFFCTIVLELFYFPELSLWGLLLCGLLLYIAVRDLDSVYSSYQEIGLESTESFIMKPLRHILSERKSRKIALFLLINTGYMVVEFVAGFMSNSLGLISDACHMLFDCAALAIGLYASYISRLPANNQFNYGRGRFEVLSGYVNAVFLVLVGALIVLESFERILDPQEISTNSLLVVSIGGLVVNMVGLIFFHDEHHHAHGGYGCSHSHSQSHSQHHQHGHHDCDGKDHEAVMVCDEHHHDQPGSIGICEVQKAEVAGCHDKHGHDNEHDHHNHDKQHHHHGDHRHGHDHDRGHDHRHDHRDLDHQHGDHRLDHHSHDLHHHHHCQDHDHHHYHCHYNHNHNHNHHNKNQLKHHHHHIDHNMEGIFLHVLADTMGSVGVVISTLLIKYKGWLVADPACSIFISIMIVSTVIPLLRNSAEILLQRVPRAHEDDLKESIKNVMKIKGVCGIQKLHVWSFTNTDVVGTLHLLVSAGSDKASIRTRVLHMLEDAGVKDLTLQVECVA